MLKRLFGLEKRAEPVPNGDNYWSRWSAMRSGTGNPESLAAVYACVSAISETIASLPLHLYKRGDLKERAKEHSLYKVLHTQPNPYQTALEFRESMQAAVLLTGNAFARIERGSDGQVVALHPVGSMSIHETPTGIVYEYAGRQGTLHRLLPHEVFHLRHRASTGSPLLGVSPIQASRETVSMAHAEREHGRQTFENGGRLSGILKFPQKLKDDQRASLRSSWESQHAGSANAGKTAILEAGVEYQTVSMSMQDAEYLASREFSVEEIARLFRVPPTVIGDLKHGNYSNSVEMNRIFVTMTLSRHLVMWEQAISTQLLTEAGRKRYRAKHSVEGLLRGDSKNRAEFYKLGIDAGWLLPSDARALEDMPVVEGLGSGKG